MGGILDEILQVRTNGNGDFQQAWDHVLFKREIETLLAEGRIEEVVCPPRNSKYPPDYESRRFREVETGETYEYIGPGERKEPSFRRVALG